MEMRSPASHYPVCTYVQSCPVPGADRHSALLNFAQLVPAQRSDWAGRLCGARVPSRVAAAPPRSQLSFLTRPPGLGAGPGPGRSPPATAPGPPRAASGPAAEWDCSEGGGRGGGQGSGARGGPRRPHSSGVRGRGVGSDRLSPYTQAPSAWGFPGFSPSCCKQRCGVAGLAPGPARPGERWGRGPAGARGALGRVCGRLGGATSRAGGDCPFPRYPLVSGGCPGADWLLLGGKSDILELVNGDVLGKAPAAARSSLAPAVCVPLVAASQQETLGPCFVGQRFLISVFYRVNDRRPERGREQCWGDSSSNVGFVNSLVVLRICNMEKQVLGSSEERTFQYQDSLPSLPVPPLDESLSKYLDAGNDLILQR